MHETNRTPRWKQGLFLGAALIAAVLVFVAWYRLHYSMDLARAFEVAGSPSGPRVLIATQGSAFKDALTTGLVEHLQRRSAHVKVIDVSGLKAVQRNDWDAIVVIHTWEMRKPPPAVKAFVDQTPAPGKLVVLTTSGAGTFALAGVDAISAASQMADAPARVSEMAVKLDAILNGPSSGHISARSW